jgi:hypothetical protein
MSVNYYNLSEDWGWYIDIESMNPIYQNPKIITNFNPKMVNKKINYNLNKLYTIEEADDEYEYYIKNSIDIEDGYNKKTDYKSDNKKMSYFSNINSTMCVTSILLTYIIFCVF